MKMDDHLSFKKRNGRCVAAGDVNRRMRELSARLEEYASLYRSEGVSQTLLDAAYTALDKMIDDVGAARKMLIKLEAAAVEAAEEAALDAAIENFHRVA
jgi:hypothetical protein